MQFFLGTAGFSTIVIGGLYQSVRIIAAGIFIMLLMCFFD